MGPLRNRGSVDPDPDLLKTGEGLLHACISSYYYYCKLYWTVKQDIPYGTSANGTL
jgi:hypothetical protein